MQMICSAILIVSYVSVAVAQQSATEQALSAKLIKEINEGLSCSVSLSQAQAKIADLERKIADVEKK